MRVIEITNLICVKKGKRAGKKVLKSVEVNGLSMFEFCFTLEFVV
jgi:hypothetical protein